MQGIKISISILLFTQLFSCQNFSSKLLYEGYGQVGEHTRGIGIGNKEIIMSSRNGYLTYFHLDSLKIINQLKIKGAEDLRGVILTKENNTIAINSGKQGLIYLITNHKIDTVFEQNNLFLDAIDINSEGVGFAFGDPIDSCFSLFKTLNFGKTWLKVECDKLPKPLKNEAGFAASNSGLQIINNTIYIATGSSDTARLIKSMDIGKSWEAINTPIKSGGAFGIYSLSFWNKNSGVVAGGSYLDSTYNESIASLTRNGGETWRNISKGLPGYISCITSSPNGSLLIATGRLGVYYSLNKGKVWHCFSPKPFYTVKVTKSKIILVGKNGVLSVYSYLL